MSAHIVIGERKILNSESEEIINYYLIFHEILVHYGKSLPVCRAIRLGKC